MIAVKYCNLPAEEINRIEPLWEKLNSYHFAKATIFQQTFRQRTFTERKNHWAKGKKELKIRIAQESGSFRIVGYCISSVSWEGSGEVDSLYLDEEFRRMGIARELMQDSLEWLEQNDVTDIKISVIVGNEEALLFYDQMGFAPHSYILNKKPV